MNEPAIRAVFFDIGNVLLRFSASDILREVAALIGQHPVKVARYLWHSRIGDEIELGRVTGRQLHALFRRELGFRGDYRSFCRLWCDHFTLERSTAKLLERLSSTHRVYLLSNTNALHYEFIRERYAFPRHVHGAVLSYRLRLRKPDPGIYRAALRLARVRPEQAVFIDDLRENVEGARKIGMRGIRYVGYADLAKRLRALGVLRRG